MEHYPLLRSNTFRIRFMEIFLKYKRMGYDDYTARYLTYRHLQ